MKFDSKVDFRRMKDAVGTALENGMDTATISLSVIMRDMLSFPGTGRLYRANKGSKKGRNLRERGAHRASAPGEPPAVNTNRLRASWSAGLEPSRDTHLVKKKTSSRVRLEYGSNVPYASRLESGTSRMDPRPYIAPSVEILRGHIQEIFTEALRETLGEEH